MGDALLWRRDFFDEQRFPLRYIKECSLGHILPDEQHKVLRFGGGLFPGKTSLSTSGRALPVRHPSIGANV